MTEAPRLLLACVVNGTPTRRSIPANRTLAEFLREDLGLTGTHVGCNTGDCGACTVLLDRRPVVSCLVLAAEAEGAQITTIEGLARDQALHPVQAAFLRAHAAQCGFCTPGMVMAAVALLAVEPHPDEAAVRAGLEGNLCRCTGYARIVAAVQRAAGTAP